ncbi:hypothetical protein [Aliarcobacter butzleri]|uniref:hypothetical protein n=1 Tax=Aliarcobacter butzleri TaxID=28197 RepID=UPI003B22537D
MPNNYTENAALWKQLSEIDYFTMFVKAWIPFNAWMRNAYDLKQDRQIINEIKNNNNRFKDRLKNLILSDSSDSNILKTYIQNLHLRLQEIPLNLDGQNRVSFENIVVEQNNITTHTFDYTDVRYVVRKNANDWISEATKISTSTIIFSYTHNKYDLNDLISQSSYIGLTDIRKRMMKQCYDEVNPRKPYNLLSTDSRNCIQCGNIKFINDGELLVKGLIEILYLLRNGLFHGEIVPDRQTAKIYEQGYHILKMGIEQI